MPSWQLILDNALDGTSNMAIDAALLDEVEHSETSRTIVRFYRWKRPTISLGRNQKIDAAVDKAFCEGHGVDVAELATHDYAIDPPGVPAHHPLTADLHVFLLSERSA